MQLDEQLKFLSDFSGLTQEKENTITAANPAGLAMKAKVERSKVEMVEDTELSEFCKRYGLEKLNRLISDASLLLKESDLTSIESDSEIKKQTDQDNRLRRDSLSVSECALPEMDSSNRMKSFLIEETDIHRLRGTSRSLSLPSTLLPTSDVLENFETYLDMTGAEQPEMKPHEKLLASWCSPDQERILKNGEVNYCRELLDSLSSDRYVSLTLSGEDDVDVRALLKKGLSDSQQELLDLLHNFKEGDCTISHAEKQFQLWREKHCGCHSSPGRTNKTSVFALPWRKTKKKICKERKEHPLEFCSSKLPVSSKLNQSKYQQKPNMKQEDEYFSRKISSTSASSASSKTSEASNVTAPFKSEERNSNELGFDESSILCTGWVSSYSPTSNRRHCSLFPEKSLPILPTRPPTLPSRPPPSPKESLILKPKPLPRKNVPKHLKKETTLTEVIVEEKDPNLQQSDAEEPNDEDKNANMFDLCQKYGLESLGECFVSGTCLPSEEQFDTERKEAPRLQTQDSDGYECPIKRTFRIRDEISNIAIVRRSASLPSDLNQSFEFPENIELDPSNHLYTGDTPSENTCNCENCYSITDSFTSNIYMSLLEFQRDNNASSKQDLCKDLSASQQELLDLMYAFKRGDKTISQVEQQFQDWHSRHMGTPANFVVGGSANKCKYGKVRKQSSFGLPGLKNFILGKPKKKNSNENKPFEYDTEIRRVKKSSETSNSSNKRLSKLSCTSNSSANSDFNEVFKTSKETGRNADGKVQVTPPVCPKRPPPMPPNKPLSNHGLGEQSQARRASESPRTNHPKTQKPIPPPKPKQLFKPKPTSLFECPTSSSKASNKTEESPLNHDEDACARPSSPDYIVPNMHKVPRTARKKTTDVKCLNVAEKCLRNFPRLRLGSESDPVTRFMMNRRPSSPTLANGGVKSSVPSAARPAMSPPIELALHPQTLELLKKANLLNIPDEKASMFYIRRSSSYPNVRVSQIRRQPIYLQILRPVSKNARRSSLFTNNVS